MSDIQIQKTEWYEKAAIVIIALLIHGSFIGSVWFIHYAPTKTAAAHFIHESVSFDDTLPATVYSQHINNGTPHADAQENVAQTASASEQASSTVHNTPEPTTKTDNKNQQCGTEPPSIVPAHTPSESTPPQINAPLASPTTEQIPDTLQNPSQTHTADRKKKRTKKKNAAPVYRYRTATRKITLADLTNGFIESIKETGNAWSQQPDTARIKQTDQEELKYVTYLQNLLWNMQNEWKIEAHTLTVQTDQPILVVVKVVIAKDGALKHVSVVQSSNSTEYDDFIVRGIRRAAPYPPVPHRIDKDVFDITVGIWHYNQPNAQQNQHAQLRSSSLLRNQP